MSRVFDNMNASRRAKKSGLKTGQEKLGLLNSALHATYELKFKAIDKNLKYYHLIGSFDSKYAPELPSYQTGEEIYWENGEDTRYGYSKLPPDELLIENLLENKQIKDSFKQFLEKHNLTANSNPKQLNEHAPKLDVLLPNWMACRCVKVTLAKGTNNRCSFSEERIEALLPDKRKRKLTIEERAKYCAKISDAINIFTHHLDLDPKNDYENEITPVVHASDTKSEESDSEPETSDSSKPQIQASSSSQTIEMDSILAEIDALLAEIQK
ncbi:12878_t:CDS:2 [Cetraspora pellucida]|uniref:12878_t:CDS:1 n=1 Tax=Cetraspora pellucida TaxID=1433469 RepID=A0ACA9L4L6_9GLOM|nr:12878_t:CDS:2 [Cetraspora pellucida]